MVKVDREGIEKQSSTKAFLLVCFCSFPKAIDTQERETRRKDEPRFLSPLVYRPSLLSNGDRENRTNGTRSDVYVRHFFLFDTVIVFRQPC